MVNKTIILMFWVERRQIPEIFKYSIYFLWVQFYMNAGLGYGKILRTSWEKTMAGKFMLRKGSNLNTFSQIISKT